MVVTGKDILRYRKEAPVRESEWMRVYKTDRGYLHDSKFLTDGLEVQAESIIGRWPRLSFHERLEFAQAFSSKPKLTVDDEKILDFLMNEGDFYVWATIAILLPKHRDRERVLAFLEERIRSEHQHKANFFQALRLTNDKKAIPALRAAYDNYREALGAGLGLGALPDYTDYLYCCEALWKIDGSPEHKQAIEEASRSQDKSVRATAERILRNQ